MQRGTAGAARFWAGIDVGRRWKSLVAIGLLAGLTAGLAAATFVGARQTDAALEHLRDRTHAADAVVFPSQVGDPHPDWSQLRDKPEVAELAVWDLLFGTADGDPGATLFVSHDGTFGDEATHPVISEGRMWDPAAPDEVVVTPFLAPDHPVGSTITIQTYGADQGDDAIEPTGPVVTLKVVGVGTTVNRFLFVEDQAFISPGFVATYGDQVQLSENADVVLHDGAADMDALQRDVNEVLAPGTPLLDLHNAARRVDTTLSVERTALLLLAAAIALAGGLLVAQTLARSSGNIADDRPALRAMGMSRGSIRASAAYTHLLPATVAALTTIAVAIVVSQWLPVGLARQIYPDVGLHVDVPVLVVAAFAAAAVVLAGAVWFVRGGPGVGARGTSGSRVAAMVRRQSPLTIGLGTTMAFDRGSDRRRVAVRPALVGAVVGVLGVTAALTVTAGVDHALAHPEQAGVTWQATVDPTPDQYGETALHPDLLDRVIEAVPAGSGVSEGDRTPMAVNGVGVPAFTLRPATDPAPALAVLSGRAPAAAGEAVIGPKTAADLHVETGDVVTVGDGQRDVTVVGQGLFPSDVHAEFDEGLWLVPEDFDAVVGPVSPDRLFEGPNRAVIVTFPAGTKPEDAIGHAQEQLGESLAFVSAPEVPLELTNLHNVRVLPLALAVFLALLAVGALSYVLVASSRRRRREFGILRAIGLDRRSVRRVVHVQATAIAIVGLVFGIVLGIVLGRAAWRLIAGEVPLQLVLPNAWLAVLLIIPIALVVVNALALWPAHRAARGRPAEALRAE